MKLKVRQACVIELPSGEQIVITQDDLEQFAYMMGLEVSEPEEDDLYAEIDPEGMSRAELKAFLEGLSSV